MEKATERRVDVFNERPEDFFPYARIEVVDKPDPTGIGMTEKIFTGPLNRQLRDALSYIKNYIIKEKVIKISNQAEAVRIFNLPYAAVEESLSNAVYHKSYQIGEPITVTVTPERMEITSLPGPDRTISNEDLMNRRLVSRRYRNRRIGDFLKELKLVEGRNTGIPTILHAMEANGSELPLFETDEDTAPYVRAFLRFCKDYSPTWQGSEIRTYHRQMMYAGTLDLLGHIEPDDGQGVDVVDLKCTAAYHSVMLATQIGAYAHAMQSHGMKIRRLYGLQLMRDGRYHFGQVDDGYKNFLHCMAIYNAMQAEIR